jgi:hypothetical protein
MPGTIDDNIDKLFDFADAAAKDAKELANRISTFIPNIEKGDLNYIDKVPDMAKPLALGDILQSDNSSETLEFINAETEALIDKYFPEINGCLRYTPEQWLCGIITGQEPFGLSKEVFEAVWHESRDREYRARNSAVEQIRSEFSQRGFRTPPGAMIKAVMLAEERASDAIGEVNRAQTVRNAEIKLDLLKFAEEQAIRLKLGIFQAISTYYRVLMDLPNKDVEASRMKVAAYASFNESMSSYYRVQLGFEELRLNAAKLRMDGKLDESRIRVASLDGSRNAALGQATRAFADVAAQAAGSAGTINANIVTG